MHNKLNSNICCILNYAPHYRKRIFQLLEQKAGARFFVGATTFAKVKKLDYSELELPVTELEFMRLPGGFYWLKGMVGLSFKPFRQYILTGEPFCLSSWLVLFFNRLQGKKTLLWTHGWYGRETGIRKWIKKLYFKCADGILLYGERSKSLLETMGFNPDRLWVVYNSLDYDQQKALRDQIPAESPYHAHFGNKYPVLLYIGRLEPNKRADILLQAYQLLGQPANLVFIGDGPSRQQLIEQAEIMGIQPGTWFYGACYDETVLAQLIAHADLTISPGYMGLTVVHAFTFGTPAIAHDDVVHQMPEAEAIVYPETGAFFKKDDAADLANTITEWLLKYPSKTKAIQDNCFRVIDTKYNPHQQVETIQNAFKQLNDD